MVPRPSTPAPLQDPDYAAGEDGQLRLGGGSMPSMDRLKERMKIKLCMVLSHTATI